MKKQDFEEQILTPKQRNCFGIGIRQQKGIIENSENILTEDEKSIKMIYPMGGEKPTIILDLGPCAPGGYPVFFVKSKKGTPTLRIAYSDWYQFIVEENHGENGDFRRGCCKYLGVELPVLPGNPNRFERYTINRTGLFSYPLIQGQQRFVLLTIENEDTELELSYFYIRYTSNMCGYDGHFKCSNEDINKLWYSSTYTAQLASIDNSQSFDIVEGMLAVRALTKGNDAGVYKKGFDWSNYTFLFDAQISQNPHCSSGIGWIVRAKDINNGYVFRLDLEGTLHKFIRKDGVNCEITPCVTLKNTIVDNTFYHIKTVIKDNRFEIYIDDVLADTFIDDTYKFGTVGFCQTVEKWAFVKNIKVIENQNILLNETLKNGLGDWEFTRSLSFIADGAKRDRLPWSGDLDWIGRNVYYAFSDYDYMPNTLRMLAHHQTPDGYMWGTCYPENSAEIRKGEFGHYQSDIFSAWFVPTLADYLLFTDDKKTAIELYQNVVKNLNYLWQYVEADGLFYQRYETSKGLWDHNLNDIGKYAYNNVIIQDAFAEGAFIAEKLGKNDDFKEFSRRAEMMKKAIVENFWDEENGYLKKGIGFEGICELANPIALSLNILPVDKAKRAIENMDKWLEEKFIYGKIISLLIRGCFNYNYSEYGYKYLTEKTGKLPYGDVIASVDWIGAINDENGPSTTIECMVYPFGSTGGGGFWQDCSHPDSGVAHILSGHILGIIPTDVGYKSFEFLPHLSGLKFAKGIVPTPYGEILAKWEKGDEVLKIWLTVPEGVNPTIKIKKEYGNTEVYINEKQTKLKNEDSTFNYF